MTHAVPTTTDIEPAAHIAINSLNMDIGDSVRISAIGKEYTLSLRNDKGAIALCLSQTMPQYEYARSYTSVSTQRTEYHGFTVTDKELEEADQPDAEA